MVKTKHGNDSMSYEEFRAKVIELLGFTPDEESCKNTYDDLFYCTEPIYNLCVAGPDWDIVKRLKHPDRFIVLHVYMGHDTVGDWCTQDCVFDYVFVDKIDKDMCCYQRRGRRLKKEDA